ncbi:MAG: hypothetical protein HXL11_02600 [Candidatus Nanosynbacter sp.]|nr:hypothetical protein [Candidatus Nanosynbacter sp.]
MYFDRCKLQKMSDEITLTLNERIDKMELVVKAQSILIGQDRKGNSYQSNILRLINDMERGLFNQCQSTAHSHRVQKTYHSMESVAWTVEEFDNYINSFNDTTKLFRETLEKFWPMRNFEPVATETKIPTVRAKFEELRDNLIQESEAG